jgi:hypothetical protein
MPLNLICSTDARWFHTIPTQQIAPLNRTSADVASRRSTSRRRLLTWPDLGVYWARRHVVEIMNLTEHLLTEC